jgi:hypothetical protein
VGAIEEIAGRSERSTLRYWPAPHEATWTWSSHSPDEGAGMFAALQVARRVAPAAHSNEGPHAQRSAPVTFPAPPAG